MFIKPIIIQERHAKTLNDFIPETSLYLLNFASKLVHAVNYIIFVSLRVK